MIRMLTLLDGYTRECPAIEVDTSICGLRVCRVLERVAGLPKPSFWIMEQSFVVRR